MDAKIMCDKELLIGYLYDEVGPSERRALEAHLSECPSCRQELGALGGTRQALAAWSPPESQLDFQIVRGARPAGVRTWRHYLTPAWGLAAAAVLVLAAAAGLANIEVRYGGDGLTVRTGWSRGGQPPAPQAAGIPASPVLTPADWSATVETLERRLRDLETSRPAAQSAVTQVASGPRVSEADMLRRVRDLLTDSETRQNRELALRIRQLATEFDTQRRVDLATIQQGLQTTTAAEAATHRQLWDLTQGLYRVSLQAK